MWQRNHDYLVHRFRKLINNYASDKFRLTTCTLLITVWYSHVQSIALTKGSVVAKADAHTHTHTHTNRNNIHLQGWAVRLATPDGKGWLVEPRAPRTADWLSGGSGECVVFFPCVCVWACLDLSGYPTLPCLIRRLHGTARGVLLSGGQGYQHTAYLLPARRVYRSD